LEEDTETRKATSCFPVVALAGRKPALFFLLRYLHYYKSLGVLERRSFQDSSKLRPLG
jgi:hypothetical protein